MRVPRSSNWSANWVAKLASRDELENTLDRLIERGQLVEVRSGHFVVTRFSREYAVGRLNMHRDGYGFLIPDHPIEGLRGDVYIPRESAQAAMHGDRVVVRIARIERDGRADGEIVKVLRRAHQTVVGEFRIRKRGNFVAPHDERIRQWIQIPVGMELPSAALSRDRVGVTPVDVKSPEDLDGMVVNVEILEFPEGGEYAVGRVIEILGRPDDFGVDVEIMIRKHHIPHHFPPEVLEQAQNFSNVIREDELAGRQDYRGARYRNHRWRNRARFRRRRLGGSIAERQLCSARPHRRRQPLREARQPDR